MRSTFSNVNEQQALLGASDASLSCAVLPCAVLLPLCVAPLCYASSYCTASGGKDERKDPPYGADVLRLWVASVDYNNDVMVRK